MFKFVKILLNKNIQAPKLSWRTSLMGAKINSFIGELQDCIHPNKIGQEFKKVMWANPSEEMVQSVCQKFQKETGVRLFMVDTKDAHCFSDFANILLRDMKKGVYPKDLKYVVFGHGTGSSVVQSGSDSWRALGNRSIGIFDYINKHIPQGEKVLVNCCELTPKSLKSLLPKDKPAIGYPTYTDASSSYYHPLKIVESGANKIIGGYANGIMTLYK